LSNVLLQKKFRTVEFFGAGVIARLIGDQK